MPDFGYDIFVKFTIFGLISFRWIKTSRFNVVILQMMETFFEVFWTIQHLNLFVLYYIQEKNLVII